MDKPENIFHFGARTESARMLLLKLRDYNLLAETSFKGNAEDKIYNHAIIDMLLQSKDNIARFMDWSFFNPLELEGFKNITSNKSITSTMEENKSQTTKRQRLAKVGKAIATFTAELLATIFSGLGVVFLYILYVPFAVGRALFNRKAICGFYSDVFYAVDGISARIRKREKEE